MAAPAPVPVSLRLACALVVVGASTFASCLAQGADSSASDSRAAASPVTLASTSFQSLDGKAHTIAELRGHATVVNFWATWCGPCREEMPRLQKLADLYAARGVTFVAISLDEPATRHKIPAMMAKDAPRIPVWVGATEKTLADLKLGELVPATLLLDERGEVIGKVEGEARDKDVTSRLDWLLGGRAGKQPKLVQRNDW